MSKSDEIEYIKHIFIEINYIQNVVEKLNEEEFYNDETLKRVIIRALEIIGEATKNLNIDFRLKYNSVPWSYMAKLRDKIIHHYVHIRIVFPCFPNDCFHSELGFFKRIHRILIVVHRKFNKQQVQRAFG